MTDSATKSFKVDASKGGCTGLFYRSKPVLSAHSSESKWPRNGAIIKGVIPADSPGWVKVDGGALWLPMVVDGVKCLHELE